MLENALRIGSVRGVDVKVHVSWLFIAALIGWSFWGRFVVWYDRPTGTAVVMAAVAALLFFVSILAHELAHALEARHRGVEVGGITLFLFGGVTETRFDVERPGDEFALTAIGPATSFVLAAGFGLLTVLTDTTLNWPAAAETLGNLAWINLALGAFNLLPGAPLDGGRIVRAAVWKATGSRRRGIVVAANAGRGLGGVIIAAGVVQLFVPGGFVGGLWFAVIGWFLFRSATAERLRAEAAESLDDQTADFLVDDAARPIPAHTSIDEAIRSWFLRSDADVHPVTDDDRIVGVVGVGDARDCPARVRSSTEVRDLMRPIGEVPAVGRSRPASEVLDASSGSDVVAVTEGDRVVGLVTARRLSATVDRLRRLGSGAGRPGHGSPPVDAP